MSEFNKDVGPCPLDSHLMTKDVCFLDHGLLIEGVFDYAEVVTLQNWLALATGHYPKPPKP